MRSIRLLLISVLCISLLSCNSSEKQATHSVVHAAEGALTAAISADGRYSLIYSINLGVSLWDNQTHGLKYQWKHSSDPENLIHSLAIAHDNSFAVTADNDTFAIWNIKTGKNQGYYKIKTATIRDIAISNQGRYVMYGRSDNVIVHLDLVNGRRLEFLGHQEKINSIALSPNGHFALSGGNDYTAYFWDTKTGQVLHRFNHSSRVTKVALDATGKYAFTADSLKRANIWQLTSGDLVSHLQYIARQKIFNAIRFNDDATLIATGSTNRELALWRVSDGLQLDTFSVKPRKDSRPQSAVVFDVAFTDNERALSTESSNGLLEIFTDLDTQ